MFVCSSVCAKNLMYVVVCSYFLVRIFLPIPDYMSRFSCHENVSCFSGRVNYVSRKCQKNGVTKTSHFIIIFRGPNFLSNMEIN